jgi:hypothetical protein
VHDLRIGCDDLGEPDGNLPHLRHIAAAHAILHGPSDRRTELQRGDAADEARELIGQDFFKLDPEPFARRDILRDDHRLGEKIVRQLDIERQIEADGAAPDIGAPARNIRIILEDIVEAAGHRFGGIDRRVLRQAEVNEQLRAVR